MLKYACVDKEVVFSQILVVLVGNISSTYFAIQKEEKRNDQKVVPPV
jgi:hypothetical protein